MNRTISGSSDSLILENGLTLYIPGSPDLEENGKRKPCKVIVDLIGIYYGGSNIGRNWKIKISVNSQIWDSGLITLQWNSWNIISKQIYRQELRNGCNLVQPVFFIIDAVNLTRFRFYWKGWRSDMTAIPCLEKLSRRQIVILVSIKGWRKEPAFLYFVFNATTQCVQ